MATTGVYLESFQIAGVTFWQKSLMFIEETAIDFYVFILTHKK